MSELWSPDEVMETIAEGAKFIVEQGIYVTALLPGQFEGKIALVYTLGMARFNHPDLLIPLDAHCPCETCISQYTATTPLLEAMGRVIIAKKIPWNPPTKDMVQKCSLTHGPTNSKRGLLMREVPSLRLMDFGDQIDLSMVEALYNKAGENGPYVGRFAQIYLADDAGLYPENADYTGKITLDGIPLRQQIALWHEKKILQ